MRRLHDAPTGIRRVGRVALSSYVTNGLATALGIPLIAAIMHLLFGAQAAATATVAVIVVTLPDQVAPIRGKLTQLLPAAVLAVPVFFGVQSLRADLLELTLMLVATTFFAFLGGAWGRRGLPVSISVMLAMIFALDWLVLLMIPAAFVLHLGIIRPEEQYLDRKFGDEYRSYKGQAPRYLPFIG